MQPTTTAQKAVVTQGTQMERHGEFGDRLVSVQAIVMAWDDRYSGWQPADGGGVSNVVLYQRLRSVGEVGTTTDDQPGPSQATVDVVVPPATYEYTIRGERAESKEVNDKKLPLSVVPALEFQVTLHCRVTKDVNYRQVMPTFHHWQIGEAKYGLKFITTHEGTRFQNRLQKAIDHLHQQSKSVSNGSNGEEGGNDIDDDVFVPVELPLSRSESWESGVTSKSAPADVKFNVSTTRAPASTTVIVHPPPPSMPSSTKLKKSVVSATGVPSTEYGPRIGHTPSWPKTPTTIEVFPHSKSSTSPYSSVYFQKQSTTMKPPLGLHRPASTGGLQPSTSYQAPINKQSVARSVTLVRSKELEKSESASLLTPRPNTGLGGRPMPIVSIVTRRERCFYCKSLYNEQENGRGSCPNAPDPCAKWIRRGTCLWCPECLLVQCFNGDSLDEADVCSCSPDVPNRASRWAILSLLTLVLPCLCLYPPLAVCYGMCRGRGLVGGRHRPSGSTQSSASGGRSSSAARMSSPEASSAHYK